MVGFTFRPAPSVRFHIDTIPEEYRRKVWLLFHLHEAGIRGNNLFRLYCVYIRSRIEYLSASYHSIRLAGQAEALERLHHYAVLVCFGFGGDVGEVMAERGIESFCTRRVRRVDAFIAKAAGNPRFAHWFPLREPGAMSLRTPRRIQELRSKTSRSHSGPLAFIQRRANELGIVPGRA